VCKKVINATLLLVSGDMMVYAGGQQPYQRINVGTNVLEAKFTVSG